MSFTERTIDGVVILDLSGHLTEQVGGKLIARVRQLVAAGRTAVLLDLASISYVDSAGLGALVASLKVLRSVDGRLKVVHPSVRTQRLLEITALTTIIESFDAEAVAVASFAVV